MRMQICILYIYIYNLYFCIFLLLFVESNPWPMAFVGLLSQAETTTKHLTHDMFLLMFPTFSKDGSSCLHTFARIVVLYYYMILPCWIMLVCNFCACSPQAFLWISNTIVGGAGQACGSSFMRATPNSLET